ncbi:MULTISPECIES: DUF1963 domain-containing protein [unclassified Streptomyces]|uniref:DUF1963 domain-containing protein n=1 Tax=unclassified Streptomyces TaxID=2593676 RepID=UPI0033F66443
MPADTPEPPAHDLRALVPEYAALVRETTLLNPEPGNPGMKVSSLGGALLWPADEPWPYCANDEHWTSVYPDNAQVSPGAVPMVPILQLFARDVPGLEFPEGKDLLQLVWCALIHEQDPGPVVPRLYWRNEAEVVAAGLLSEIPEVSEGEYDEDHMPERSTLSPTIAQDYPSWHDLSEDTLTLWGSRVVLPDDDCNVVGTKVGGWPAWTQRGNWPDCESGHRMEHLLTITGDMQLGDCGGVYFFRCRQCPGLPWDWRYDCY